MRFVPHAAIRPHHCAAFPSVRNATTRKGFIDTGVDLRDPDSHVYISVEAVEVMARMIGWAPQHVNQAAQRKQVRAEEESKRKDEEIAVLQRQLEAVETLRNAGFKEKVRKVAA